MAWIFYDTPLTQEVKTVLDQPDMFDASPDNGFLLMVGLGHQDPQSVGQRWVADAQQRVDDAKAPSSNTAAWSTLADPPPVLALKSEAGQALTCDARQFNCFEVDRFAAAAPDLLPLIENLIGQYQAMLAAPRYVEYADHIRRLGLDAPVPAMSGLNLAQSAFHARLRGLQKHDLGPALLQERLGLIKLMRGSTTLISKMITANMALKHLWVVHDAIKAGRVPAAADRSQLTSLFDEATFSLEQPLRTEMLGQLRIYQFVMHGQGQSTNNSEFLAPLRAVYQHAVYKPNDTINRAYRAFQSINAVQPQLPNVAPEAAPASWVFNPMGGILLSVAHADFTSYRLRIGDVNRLQSGLNQCRAGSATTVTMAVKFEAKTTDKLKPRLREGNQLVC
jgi:hypothetical protein